MTFRRIIFWAHLLAGTTAGLVILVMSTTGVLLAFEAQIVDFAERSVRTVTPPAPDARRLSMDVVMAAARRDRPDAMPTFLSMRAGPTAAVRVDLGRDAALFVDPYTGEVVGPGSRVRAAMHLIEDWHRWLGSRDVGRPITGACNAAFFVLCVTGVYLWWPRNWNRRTLRAVTWFTPRLRGRMRNWNWHNVVGFWCAPALIVITLTGVIMSYQWASDLLYTLTGNEPPPPVVAAGERVTAPPGVGGARRPEAVGATGGRRPATVEALWARAEQQSPGWVVMTLRLPPRSGGAVSVFIQEPATWHPTPRSLLTLDPLTAEVVKWEPYSAVNLGRTLRFWARPLHTGTAVGPIGQAIAALASAGGVMLVWTGVALAWRRFQAWLARSVSHRAPVKTSGVINTSPIQGEDKP